MPDLLPVKRRGGAGSMSRITRLLLSVETTRVSWKRCCSSTGCTGYVERRYHMVLERYSKTLLYNNTALPGWSREYVKDYTPFTLSRNNTGFLEEMLQFYGMYWECRQEISHITIRCNSVFTSVSSRFYLFIRPNESCNVSLIPLLLPHPYRHPPTHPPTHDIKWSFPYTFCQTFCIVSSFCQLCS